MALFIVDMIAEQQQPDNQKNNQSQQDQQNANNFEHHKNDFKMKQKQSNNSLQLIFEKNENNFQKTDDQYFKKQIKQQQTDFFQQQILNSLSTGIALISRHSKLIQSNRTLKSFFGRNNLDKLNLEENLLNHQFNQNNNFSNNDHKHISPKNNNFNNIENKYFKSQGGENQKSKQSQSFDYIPKILQGTQYCNLPSPQANNSQRSKQNTHVFHKITTSSKQVKQPSNNNEFKEKNYKQEAKQAFQSNFQFETKQKNAILNQSNSFEALSCNHNVDNNCKFDGFSRLEFNPNDKKSRFDDNKLPQWKKMYIEFNEDLQNLLNSPKFSILQVINQLFKSKIDSFRILRSEFAISNSQKLKMQTQANQNFKSKFGRVSNNANEQNKKFYQIVNNNTLLLRGKTYSGETLFKISIYKYKSKQFKSNLKCTEDVLDNQENMKIDSKETLVMIELVNIDNLIKQRDINDLKSFKKKMLASLSHELRTPLNCSMQLIETLYHSGLLQDEDRDLFLTPAIQSNQLLLHIINDILDFCQINNGDLRLIFEEFEIRQAIYECIQLFALQSSQKNLPIEICFDSQLPLYVRSDQNRFKQVFLNILSNAVKFTEQGKITVKVDYCQFLGTQIDNFAKISIQDTGCGITPEIAKNIFNGFNCSNLFQDKSIKPDLQKVNAKNFQDPPYCYQNAYQVQHECSSRVGAGLGLSISQNLAKGLGSNRGIEFSSQPNIGSIFTFYVADRRQQVPGCKLNIRTFHDIQFFNWQTLESASSHKIQTSATLADKSKRISISHKSIRFSQFQLENNSSQRKISVQFSHQSQIDPEKIKTLNQMSKSSLMISDRNIDINQDFTLRKNSKFQETRDKVVQLQSLRRWQQELDKQMYNSYQEIPRINKEQASYNSCAVEESFNLDSSYHDINQAQGIKSIYNIEIQTSGNYLQQSSQIFQQPTNQRNNKQKYNETQNQYKLDTKKCIQTLSIMSNSESKKINQQKQMLSTKSIPSQNNFELENQNAAEKQNNKHLVYSQNQILMECAKSPEVETLKEKINSKDKFNFKQDIQNISNSIQIDNSQQNIPKDDEDFLSKTNSQFSIEISQELSQQQIQNNYENSENIKKLNRNNQLICCNTRCNTIYHEATQYKNNNDIIKQKIKDTNKCNCPSILIVDDNDFNLYALEVRLKPYNLQVDKANNGLVALEKVQARYYSNDCCQKYQLIFMDIDMPIKNGYQAAQEINLFFKTINMKKLSPISACTAFIQEEEKQKAFESGMQYYITKPVDSQKLEKVLLKVFKV
ncbi:hypothetical protein ABPG72_002890 [Tetrahymena utriculariae]